MAHNPLQDRIKSQRDQIFFKQKFHSVESISSTVHFKLEVTHIIGKRIFKTWQIYIAHFRVSHYCVSRIELDFMLN